MNSYTNADIRRACPGLIDRLSGPLPPENFQSDGCTCSPDSLLPWVLWPACHFHDFHYRGLGVSSQLRTRADRWLYENLVTCRAPRWVAFCYWIHVRAWGFRHYRWRFGCRPNLYERFVLFVRSLVRF